MLSNFLSLLPLGRTMYIMFLVPFLPLVAGFVAANSPHSFVSPLASRQILSPRSSATDSCNATCTPFKEMKASCVTPHCGCTVPFLGAQMACLLCQLNETPEDEASVYFLLDREIAQCHSENTKINFQLDLPPAAAAIVQKINSDIASLGRAQTVYLALQIAGGHIGLVVALAFSVCSNKIHRDPTYINFCITWIFSSIAYSLLLYRGTADDNIINPLNVPQNMCLTQSALTEGAQVMTAASTLALVIQLWLHLRIAIYGDSYGPKRARWTTIVLLVTPYMLSLAFGISALFDGSKQYFDSIAQRAVSARFYCILVGHKSFLRAVYSVSVTLLILTLIFDALIIDILYKNWRAFRKAKTENAVTLSVLLRFVGFSIYRVLVAIAYVSVLSRLSSFNPTLLPTSQILPPVSLIPIWVDMLQATIPGVAFLVLGINRDLIHFMMFWRWFHAKQ